MIKQYIIELDEDFIKKRLVALEDKPKPMEDVIYNAMDFYLFNYTTDREYIKVKRLTYGVK